MELCVTTSDMNPRKLVPLEVHGRLGNIKIAKKNLSMLEWGEPYIVGKLRKGLSNKLKNTPIEYLVREIRP